ncbi:MAG: RodZ domain-containing protein [Candidatus Omnitrophota bacterium]|nr:DUF4115 domain-containing protein [Candidatus Omnitrophota bacterium]
MEQVGSQLKKIRLQRGLSLNDVQKGTKIHLNILQAIESDSFLNVNPVYIKGFIKIYCNYLGLNTKDFIPDYKDNPTKIYIPEEGSGRKALPSEGTNIKIAGLGRPKKLKKIFVFLAVLVIVILLFFTVKIGLKKIRISSSTREVIQKTQNPIPKKTLKKVVRKSSGTMSAVKPKEAFVTPQTLKTVSGIRLGMRVKEDCYVELRIDGSLILRNILKKDTFESWQAREKIELSLGNAGGVSLEVNGETLQSLGKRGQVIKGIIITKDGLKVSR